MLLLAESQIILSWEEQLIWLTAVPLAYSGARNGSERSRALLLGQQFRKLIFSGGPDVLETVLLVCC